MTAIDWVIFVLAWSLIPVCLVMKAYFDHQARMSAIELNKRLAEIWRAAPSPEERAPR